MPVSITYDFREWSRAALTHPVDCSLVISVDQIFFQKVYAIM